MPRRHALTYHIDTVRFLSNGGIVVSYAGLPGDSRAKTVVMMSHQIAIEPTDAYLDAINQIREAAQELVADVLEDWPVLPIDDPAEVLQPPEDEPEGMGEG
jgi:hypothetical protein